MTRACAGAVARRPFGKGVHFRKKRIPRRCLFRKTPPTVLLLLRNEATHELRQKFLWVHSGGLRRLPKGLLL